jgi:hypothetical protein
LFFGRPDSKEVGLGKQEEFLAHRQEIFVAVGETFGPKGRDF